MALIEISNLNSVTNTDSESFLTELQTTDATEIFGGSGGKGYKNKGYKHKGYKHKGGGYCGGYYGGYHGGDDGDDDGDDRGGYHGGDDD